MTRRIDHQRLSPDEFAARLEACDITPVEFTFLTGANRNTVRSWLLPEDHPKANEPPFWVTSWLTLYANLGRPEIAREIAEANLLGMDDHDPEPTPDTDT